MGIERLVLLKGENRVSPSRPDIFLAALGEKAARHSFTLMSSLQRGGIHAEMDFEGKSLKAQLRRADKLQSRHVLILGENEIASGKLILRDMSSGLQEEIPMEKREEILRARIGEAP
jgi:histidyl-tRNA synthetase